MKTVNAQSILKPNKNDYNNASMTNRSPLFSQFSKKFCKILKTIYVNAIQVILSQLLLVSFSLLVECESAYFYAYCEN